VPQSQEIRLNVVLFSGGRGSSVLSTRLVRHPRVSLVVAINGYDDGASTGEVRRFLGDSLGPSDFRKNASRIARELQSVPASLVDLLDLRLPDPCESAAALTILRQVGGESGVPPAGFAARVRALADGLDAPPRARVGERLTRFLQELASTGRPFDFSDCAVGNLVFAGSFLGAERRFNPANDDYCALLGLPAGLVENVSDGTNAFLTAIDLDDRLLGSEAEIVDAKRRNRIKDIYLIDRPVADDERARLDGAPHEAAVKWLEGRARSIAVNPRLIARIAHADLIIYSPGTQHSSLFPSYLTPGLSEAIARNLTAIKLLVTNIQSDAEITGSSAVDIIERALYYMKEKGRLGIPTPCLITHYVINDPGSAELPAPYVAPGRLDALEDPRLVRIGHYEDGVTGRHDASKVLQPFLDAFLAERRRPRMAVWLYDAGSLSKLSQSILEMLRGGVQRLPVDVTVFYAHPQELDPTFVGSLPFPVRCLSGPGRSPGEAFSEVARHGQFDYAVLFESSGMYKGEDLVALLSPLATGRLDAVWGSRRLSVKEIEASLRLRYRHHVVLRTLSYLGSHLLSFAYLLCYGRYISDTLSGARAVRTTFLAGIALDHKLANQHILSALLGQKADVLETPVQFLPLSPGRVRRTSVMEGLQSLGVIAWRRVFRAGIGTVPGAAAESMPLDDRRANGASWDPDES
jgi:2-phospho-L-lactate transferase/gluconeogenesis factor (CofD/UPF0052 family)